MARRAAASGGSAAERSTEREPINRKASPTLTPRLVVEDLGEYQFDVLAFAKGIDAPVGKLEAGYVSDRGIKRFWIGNCSVDEKYRRTGIGTGLVGEALREGLRRYQVDRAYIDAINEDGVQAFWINGGFSPEVKQRMKGRAFHGVLMSRPLP